LTPAAHYNRPGTRFSRKDVLKMGLLGTAAVALPLERAARTQLAAPRLTEAQLPAPFRAEFAVPPSPSPSTGTRPPTTTR
jgi:hypothetical protein